MKSCCARACVCVCEVCLIIVSALVSSVCFDVCGVVFMSSLTVYCCWESIVVGQRLIGVVVSFEMFFRCFIMDDRGYLVAHRGLIEANDRGPLEEKHITHKAGIVIIYSNWH